MPKIEIEVRHVGSDATWMEQYECDGDPEQWAKDLLDRFNATLREDQLSRELVAVRVVADQPTVTDQEPLTKEQEQWWKRLQSVVADAPDGIEVLVSYGEMFLCEAGERRRMLDADTDEANFIDVADSPSLVPWTEHI